MEQQHTAESIKAALLSRLPAESCEVWKEEAFEVLFDLLSFLFFFSTPHPPPLPLAPPPSPTPKQLPPNNIKVVDQSGGCGSAFEVTKVVSSSFEAKAPLARHRLVNAALKEELATIHALSIKRCLTPQEEEKNAGKE